MSSLRRLIPSLLWTVVSAVAFGQNVINATTAPTADVKNGTYVGTYNPTYGLEYFLGMPFAQPPQGSLRFRVPQPLNASWSGSRNATQYGYECIGYGLDTESQGNLVSEDCLTLNVVRSRGSGEKLPVVVWIHGGGWVEGGSADRRYNQSFIVQQSAEAGMPIIAVSINYRLSAWGFIYGKAFQESGNTNLGYRDQRLALHWVKENIAAFGGDPDRITIQGESAGSWAVGVHLLAYGGRDDHLFVRAISESGAVATAEAYPTVDSWEPVIKNISMATGCQNASDVLECFRAVPVDKLNSVINSTYTTGASYGAVVDGDLVAEAASVQLEQGKFVRVPYIIGTNTDEGTVFGPPQYNTTAQFQAFVRTNSYTGLVDNETVRDISLLYPDIPAIGIPETIPGRPNSTVGLQFKRTSAYAGDLVMQAPRRFLSQAWVQQNATLFTYRFNALVNGVPFYLGAPHFQEVAFVFYNTEGYGYAQNGLPNPMGGVERPAYLKLALLMVRMWISFINHGNPNEQLGVTAETWPAYTLDAPRNFVFEQNVTSHAEDDVYRAEGIEYIRQLISARRGRNCTGIAACLSAK